MLPRTRLLARPLLSSHWTPSPTVLRSSPIASSSSSLLLARPASTSSSSNKKAPQKSPILRDEDIPHPLITLVDPSTSSLLPPASLQDILVQLDRTRFSIVLVDSKAEVPVCRIVDKKAEFERARAKKSSNKATTSDADAPQPKAKAPAGPPKEVHLTWGVTPHDLGHKLSKARDFLAKGSRVVVVLKDKKGVEKVGKGQQQTVVGNVVEAVKGSGKLVREQGKGGEWRVEFAPAE